MTNPQPQPSQQQPQLVEPLTQREVEVMFFLFNFELDYSEIANELSVSKATVSFHVLNIFTKLAVDSRFAAVCSYARLSPAYRQAFFQSLKT